MRRFLSSLLLFLRKRFPLTRPERFPLLKKAYRTLKKLFKTTETVIDGHRMVLDSSDSLNLSIDPSYESIERNVVSREVIPGNRVVDVGANIGVYTLLLARLVGPGGKVFAFEPCPPNFRLLVENVRINGYGNVTAVQKAVSDKEGRSELFLHEEDCGDHRIFDGSGERKKIEIETTSLDTFFRDNPGGIDFIKMDIQGAEVLALHGMKEVLRESASLKMLVEFWPFGLRECGASASELLEILLKQGFRLWEIRSSTGTLEEIRNTDELLRSYPEKPKYHTNLLCLRISC